jgi:hypothetical protein
VIGAEPRVRDVAEDVLGEQRRSQREERDRGDDRSPENATRKRGRGGDDQDVAGERNDEEGKEVLAVQAKSAPVRAEQPARVAADSRRHQARPRQRKRDRADDEDRDSGERDCAPSMCPQAGRGR